MLRNRCGFSPIEPELLARVGADRNKALAAPSVGHSDDFGRRARDRRVIIADDVADQHHLGQAAALRFGRVAHRAQIAVVEMFEPRQGGAARTPRKVVGDVDDRRDRFARLPEKFQAHGANVGRHLVHDPACRRDQPVAPLLLHAGQATEKFVGDVLAKADLAKLRSFKLKAFCPQHLGPVG